MLSFLYRPVLRHGRTARLCLLAGVAALAALAAPSLATASPQALKTPATYRYEIRMEGRPIGSEVVTIAPQGEETLVTVQTNTKVNILFLSFSYEHQRRETWHNGTLRQVTAHTDDDGTVTDLQAQALPGGVWKFRVNGRESQRQDDSLPLSLWTSAVVEKSHLYSVIDATPYAVQAVAQGAEPLAQQGSRTAEVQHYSLTGDMPRELWFDDHGVLQRTTFARKGYPIEMVRVSGP